MAYVEKTNDRTRNNKEDRRDDRSSSKGNYESYKSNSRSDNRGSNYRRDDRSSNKINNYRDNGPRRDNYRRDDRSSNKINNYRDNGPRRDNYRNNGPRRDDKFSNRRDSPRRNDRRGDGNQKKMLIESEITHKFDLVEKSKGKTYRVWEPKRSKLGAAITKGLKNNDFNENSNVLYLGASHGYTSSFVSDIFKNGSVFALDFEPRVVRDLVIVAEKRNNLIPILGDARFIETFKHKVLPSFDILFMDIAQKDQAEIFIKNLSFLKKGGYGYLALKARAVDSTANPENVFRMVEKKLLESTKIKILEEISLEPFERDHLMFIVRKN